MIRHNRFEPTVVQEEQKDGFSVNSEAALALSLRKGIFLLWRFGFQNILLIKNF